MDGIDLVDSELRDALQMFPQFDYSAATLPFLRQSSTMIIELPGVQEAMSASTQYHVPGPAGAPDVRVVVHGPDKPVTSPLPAILHIHGGGFILGSPEINAVGNRDLAKELNCVVVSVDYRLAPETPYPGAIEDCYAALNWLYLKADELGVDRNRIGVSGESAGGGLAAALALMARDRNEVPLAFQHLIYPMLDDRTCIAARPHPHTGFHVWTRPSNIFGWSSLLGRAPGEDVVESYAAPARASDLSGLPPTYIAVGALDLFLDEDVDYALRLTRAGVMVDFRIYSGAYHGFQVAAEAAVSRAAIRDSVEALQRLMIV